ncbi:RNA polymerase sigma factor [Paenibacillus glycanilyticus]|uniref:RNA polymerase sigma factor n=1 Tax=Paenibacillus glycanilyticus TaxID=126569 RepID=A0ABQ6GNF7_9BACL|nr:RNA polymerase sigma factor [Paenibacillus glycanilyticus]GLX70552.1 hypothetical protein MU1_48980 [Paenibacillus glycanilyticus]
MADPTMNKDNKEWERLQGVLSRYCIGLTKTRAEAEDLAQETWLKAIESLSLPNHANPDAYMLRIARNTWIDRVRRQSTQVRIMESVRSSAKKHELPDESKLGSEMAMQAIMEYLSPLQQAVFLLRDVFGYSAQETALRLGISIGAAKAALHRARAALPSVRHAIHQGTLPYPDDEGLRHVLRALAIAYEGGDVDAMLTLVQQGELEPASAIAVLQSRRQQSSGVSSHRRNPALPMALAA